MDDRIAVEVRRLNQNETHLALGERARGLEEVAIPLRKNIQRLLPSLGPPKGRVSWCLFVKYSRPVPRRKQIADAICGHFQVFRDGPTQNPLTIPIFRNFVLKLFPAGRLYPDYFVTAGRSDYDSGGWVIPKETSNSASTRKQRRCPPSERNMLSGGFCSSITSITELHQLRS